MTKKILAVDDEPEILNLFNTFLDFQGYQVRVANSARKCLEAIKQDVPDMILLDVNMPRIDGLQLLEMIKAEPKAKEIPIIMISARRDEDTIRRAVQLGCDNFIVKPFKLAELAQRISDELYALEFNTVQDILGRLQSPNPLFNGPGTNYAEYDNQDWDPYLVKQDDKELCFLVTRGQRPPPLAKLPEDQVKDKVAVFIRQRTRWKRIWPKRV